MFGVDENTITNWEKHRSGPRLMYLPRIIQFLGYNPWVSVATTLGEKIKQYRIQKGLSLRKLAQKVGVDPGTLAKWESSKGVPSGKLRDQLKTFFGVLP